MSDFKLGSKHYDFCNDFDVVEKSIIVSVDLNTGPARVRIDALRGRDGQYSTEAFREEAFILRPQGSEEAKTVHIWVDYDLPWTHRPSADEALAQALSFLSERCSKN